MAVLRLPSARFGVYRSRALLSKILIFHTLFTKKDMFQRIFMRGGSPSFPNSVMIRAWIRARVMLFLILILVFSLKLELTWGTLKLGTHPPRQNATYLSHIIQ